MKTIFLADLETSTKQTKYFQEHQDTTVLVGYIENKENDESCYFRDLKGMIEFLKSVGKDCLVYFHNLKFDGDFILKYLAKNNYKLKNYDDVKKVNDFGMLRQINKIYAIKLNLYSIKTKKQFCVEFRCSLMMLSSGVAALGKCFGLNKMETNYHIEPQKDWQDYPKQFLEYLKRDVQIVKKAINYFENEIEGFVKHSQFRNYFRNFHWWKFLTIGALAYDIQWRYTKKFKEINKGLKCSLESYELASKFYFGGFTQFNEKIQNKIVECPKGLCVDINSAHPFSMTKDLPYGEMHDYDIEKPLQNEKVIYYYKIFCRQAISKYDELPCLINWNKINKTNFFTKHRYEFNLSNFTCYYQKDEWELLQQFYDFIDWKIEKTYWCYSSSYLSKCVKDLYQFKVKHDKENNNALKHIYKILLNSLYGKHSTRLNFNEYYVCSSESEYNGLLKQGHFIYNKKEYELTECNERVKLPYCWILKATPKTFKERNYNKIIASTITAYSRMNLLNTIKLMGIKNFLYCDTDSIYLKNYKQKDLDKIEDRYEIGKWKNENKKFKWFIVRGSKCYIAYDDVNKPTALVYSGINKDWLKDNFTLDFFTSDEMVMENANKVYEYYPSGIIITEKNYTAKERLY